jgi:hypothetical protein
MALENQSEVFALDKLGDLSSDLLAKRGVRDPLYQVVDMRHA